MENVTTSERVGSEQAPPKPLERTLRGLGYLSVAFTAVWLLILPPSGVSTDLGRYLTPVWCGFLLTAVPAAGSAFLGRYRGEYACIPWFTGALILGIVHAWVDVFTGAPEVAPRALVSMGLVLMVSARFVTLHQLVDIKPRGAPWTRRVSK